ncbi:hypothetical protein PF008_g28284 [Phytophthora fragariae]|uniref:Uncharacterized protein n=1 Tax=Phytophthora fragariae TaxID=53985 RepID=A0A6G0QBR5_9STRA|nr:hypothetical protein PF008_g28284 [Phytophthora fragariae]
MPWRLRNFAGTRLMIAIDLSSPSPLVTTFYSTPEIWKFVTWVRPENANSLHATLAHTGSARSLDQTHTLWSCHLDCDFIQTITFPVFGNTIETTILNELRVCNPFSLLMVLKGISFQRFYIIDATMAFSNSKFDGWIRPSSHPGNLLAIWCKFWR